MNNFPSQPKSFEQKEKLLFNAIFMRHEEPFYEDVGHDLTDGGVQGAIATGEEIKDSRFFDLDEPLFLFHSPKPRAKGTLDFVAEGAGISSESKREIKQIGQSRIHDYQAFMQYFEEINRNMETVAKDHHTSAMFENSPELIEPHSNKKKRLYRAVEYMLRNILKNQNGKTSQILAVSHFEIITHLVFDVFNIEELEQYNSPSFGERVMIRGYNTESTDKTILEVSFRSHKKRVIFNRETRSIEQI
jgi:phosphohistidine phosphatase SixA